jgi:hypothetical protein
MVMRSTLTAFSHDSFEKLHRGIFQFGIQQLIAVLAIPAGENSAFGLPNDRRSGRLPIDHMVEGKARLFPKKIGNFEHRGNGGGDPVILNLRQETG